VDRLSGTIKANRWLAAAIFLCIALFAPRAVFAFQEHGAREGMYVHQLGHVCFGAAMAWLYFMIRGSSFWEKRCWKSVAVGSALLALWNVVTFTGHIISLYSLSNCPASLPEEAGIRFWIWYACKLDNLVCVAAMFFFYVGLRQLLGRLRLEDKDSREREV